MWAYCTLVRYASQYVHLWKWWPLHGPLIRYVKLRVVPAPGMSEKFSPPPRVSDLDMHHVTCVTRVPWCISGSLTSGFLWRRWRGKLSRHSRRMRNPQFYVSGKKPMGTLDLELEWLMQRIDCLIDTIHCLAQWLFIVMKIPRINISVWRLGILLPSLKQVYWWYCFSTKCHFLKGQLIN